MLDNKEVLIDNDYIDNIESYKKRILLALEHQKVDVIRKYIKKIHSSDLGEFLNGISVSDREFVLNNIEDIFDPAVLEYFDSDMLDEMINLLGCQKVSKYIAELEVDDAISVIGKIDFKYRDEIISDKALSLNKTLQRGLSYPENSAGRLMSCNIFYVPTYYTIKQVIDQYRTYYDEIPENINEIIIVDKNFQPVGSLAMKNLLKYKDNQEIGEVMDSNIPLVETFIDAEEVTNMVKKYDLSLVIVIDDRKKLVGVITTEDVIDILEEIQEEELLSAGGLVESDIHSSLFNTLKNRTRWLFVSFIMAAGISFLINLFSDVLEHNVMIAVLMTMVGSMSANSGMQTMTVLIRELANNEVRYIKRLLVKEVSLGAINAIIYSAIIAVIIAMFDTNNIQIAIIFGVALMLAMIFGAIGGVMIPYLLSKAKMDISASSSILLFIITDFSSFALFLGIAKMLLI